MDAATETRHRYRRKGVPSRFRVRLCYEGTPLANKKYRITIDGLSRYGKTDADGVLDEAIPPNAYSADIAVTDGKRTIDFDFLLGHLEPIETIRGVQQRLANLGFSCPLTGALDELTMKSLEAFCSEQSVSWTNALTSEVRTTLKTVHDQV